MNVFSRWLAKPSKHDALLTAMREERRISAQAQTATTNLMGELVRSVAAQSAVFQNYLTMISAANAAKPEVRIMTDVDEAMLERRREAARARAEGTDPQDAVMQVLGENASQLLADAFSDLRADI